MRGAAFFHVVLKHGRTTTDGGRAAKRARGRTAPRPPPLPPFNANRAAGRASERGLCSLDNSMRGVHFEFGGYLVYERTMFRGGTDPHPMTSLSSLQSVNSDGGTVQIGPVRLPSARVCMLSSRVIDSSSSKAKAAESAAYIASAAVGRSVSWRRWCKDIAIHGDSKIAHIGRSVARPQFPYAKI